MWYTIEDISIDETLTAEKFVRSVLCTVHGYIRDGIEVSELCQILRKYYGIASAYCCDLIQRIKIELDMYCPDHKRLYFVNGVKS